ncbi:histidine kinase [Runella sp. MFBS21]|uniref:sensor histidine kinase n=1 Tax=Runella sp. MFBS21 TaxID=3034018 RepID=UPI0023F86E19|nr:ATP-binding protein [Runella sp. MFBS21]MDF7816831.1 histidine kinase [Runella sp. MFBS21]
MRNALLLSLSILCCTYAWGQTGTDSLRFDTYVQLFQKYNSETPDFNTDSSYYFASGALRFAQSTGVPFLIAQGYYYKGQSLVNSRVRLTNKAAGREEFHKAAELFKKLNKKDWYLSVIKDLYILESANYLDGKSEKAAFYQAITTEGRTQSNFHYPDNLKITEPDQPLTKATNLRVIKASEAYLQTLEVQQDEEKLMYAHEVLGKYCHYYGDYPKSINHFESAFKIAQKIDNKWFSIIILNGLVPVLLNNKKFIEAEEWVKKGLNLLQVLKMPELKRVFLDYLYRTLKEQGRWQEAFIYKEESYALQDSLREEALLKNGVFMEEKLAAERKQFAAEKEAQLQQQRLNYAIIAAAILLLIVGGLVWYSNNLRKTKKELEAKNAEISTALLLGQTQERKRVASDLHDNLVSKITGIRWRFQMIDKHALNPANAKLYDSVDQALAESLTELRLISRNLISTKFESAGLIAALEKLTNDLNELGRTRFTLSVPNLPLRFSPNIEFELYNIALELTTNILRHAHASQAQLILGATSQEIKLLIKDNGVGMPTIQNHNGMGLKNVETRTHNLHGKLEVNHETGTKIEITIPIPA